MSKTQTKKIKVFALLFLSLCLVFFNLSCGLDIIEYYEPPYSSYTPVPDSIDISQRHIDFWTNNSGNTISSFKGTTVFYKIYNSSSAAASDRDKLISLSKNDYTSSIVDTLKNNYKYCLLNNKNNLFPKNGNSDYKVVLDFTDPDGDYKIFVNNVENGVPQRIVPKNGSYLLFNFDSSYWTYDSNNDTDVEYNSSNSSDTWYVQFFAASVGLSSTLTEQYSNIVYLGCIAL